MINNRIVRTFDLDLILLETSSFITVIFLSQAKSFPRCFLHFNTIYGQFLPILKLKQFRSVLEIVFKVLGNLEPIDVIYSFFYNILSLQFFLDPKNKSIGLIFNVCSSVLKEEYFLLIQILHFDILPNKNVFGLKLRPNLIQQQMSCIYSVV